MEAVGELYVMTHGITMMHKLYAGSLDMELQVNTKSFYHYFLSLSKRRTCFHVGALAIASSRYSPGSGPIHLDDVGCIGSESSINDCKRSNYGYVSSNCRSHFEDASVICQTCMK